MAGSFVLIGGGDRDGAWSVGSFHKVLVEDVRTLVMKVSFR